MSLAFDFRDQVAGPWETAGPALVDQLDLTYAALGPMQQVTDAVTTSDVTSVTDGWIVVPYAATLFSCNSTGSITPSNARPYAVIYKVLGSIMWFHASFTLTVNNGTTTDVRIAIPGTQTLGALPIIAATSDENRLRTAGIWNNSTTAGVAGVFINMTGRFISIQRWDGIAAAGYANGDTHFFGFMVTIPLADPTA